MLKRIHVALPEDEYDQLQLLFPERGVLQHMIRRFLRESLNGSETVTVSLKLTEGGFPNAID